MKIERKKLLYSSIFMIIYVILNLLYGCIKNGFNIEFTDAIIYFTSVAGIITFLIYYFDDKINLEKHMISILIISIMFFIYNLISGVLGFIVYKNLNKREKRELPKIEKVYYHDKYLYLIGFILCMIIMFFISNYVNSTLSIVFIYISVISITIFMFYKELYRDFKVFKEYFYEYNSLVLKTFLKSLLCLAIINISIKLSTGVSTSTNQETINEVFKTSPILIILLSVVYAPIIEESLFRGIFRKFINNKYLFIIISGFIFGLMHVIDDFTSFGDFMYVLSYSCLGMFLAYTYYKTDNLWCNIYFHFLQNSLAVLAMIILTFFTK